MVAALCLTSMPTWVWAQNLPVKGAATTLDVGTWNIYFFGDDTRDPEDELQIANAAEVIRQSGIDLWSLQEIEDAADFDRLIDALGPGWRGELDRASSNLRVGYVYRTEVVEVQQLSSILSPQYSFEFAGRPPLQMKARITLPDTTFTAIFIALHMKCCADIDSWQRRAEASNRLKFHVDTFFPHDPVFVLGDFNDELTGSITPGRPSPYENFLDDSENYSFTTLGLDLTGTNTWCGSDTCASGSTIDHILITDELIDAFVSGSAETYDEVLDSQNGIPDYRSTTSDHLPVLARFNFSPATSTESPYTPQFRLHGIFPNPVRHTAHLEYSLPAPGGVVIHIVDVLGRTVYTRVDSFKPAGSHAVHLDDLDLPSGAYVMQVRTGRHELARPFVVLR